MKKVRSLFYFMTAISLLFYGLPRFKMGSIQNISQGFVLIWSLFALFIIGIHLYNWLEIGKGDDKPTHLRNRKMARSSRG